MGVVGLTGLGVGVLLLIVLSVGVEGLTGLGLLMLSTLVILPGVLTGVVGRVPALEFPGRVAESTGFLYGLLELLSIEPGRVPGAT